MVDIIPTTSVITLNINGLNVPIKRQILSEWLKNKTQIYVVTSLNYKDTYRLKVNAQSKIYHANTNQKKAEVAMLILEVKLTARKDTRDKEGHYIMIKERVGSPKKHKNLKCACTYQHSAEIC